MKYTSTQASKLLRTLNEEYDSLCVKERQSSTFLTCVGEDVESVRPDYDFLARQNSMAELQ